MKKKIQDCINSKFLLLPVFLFVFLSINIKANAQFGIDAGFFVDNGCNKLKVAWGGDDNACLTKYYNDVRIYINGTESYYGSWNSPDGIYGYNYFNISNYAPGTVLSIYATIRHIGAFCDYTVTSSTISVTIPSNQPINNVQATDNKFSDKIDITWSRISTICYNSLSYNVYENGTTLLANVPGTQLNYSHTGLSQGMTKTYTVRAVANGVQLPAVTGDQGSTFNLNLQATTNLANKITLTWNNFSGTNSPSGYAIDRSNVPPTPGFGLIYSSTFNTYISHEDLLSGGLIAGYTYLYKLKVNPGTANEFYKYALGKTLPNGRIVGDVKTPSTGSNPTGVGVPNVLIVVKLQGSALPSDTTTTYTSITDANGHYEIPNIYYFQGASFTVTPTLAGRTFSPTQTIVTLNSGAAATANFTDLSSFIVSGTISQGTCPMSGVRLILNNDTTAVTTNADGEYNLTIAIGGTYTIKPFLENHTFNSIDSVVSVTADVTNVDFDDITNYTLEGYFSASCNSYIGVAKLRFESEEAGCFVDSTLTDVNGFYSINLPARNIKISVVEFTSFNETILSSVNGLAYFSTPRMIDLTSSNQPYFHNDTATMDFVYRLLPVLQMTGLSDYHTCSGEILPVMQQNAQYDLVFNAFESFNGTNCPAGDGYIAISENISSLGVSVNHDTLYYHQGDTIHYVMTPGTPNIIAPYKKFIQVILCRDNQTDTIYSDVIVIGHRPRSQTFTTTTPQMPFHILHNPPGDNSYSYLSQNTSISNSFSTSFLQEGSVDTYIRAQLGPSISTSVGLVAEVSVEVSNQLDITGSFGTGAGGLTSDASVITSTTTDMFQTSGNVDIIGGAGDVYIGGAINMLYAVSDVVLYDFDSCKIDISNTLMMQPDGISTTFMYTESHITDVIIPELQSIADHYTSINVLDSAAFFSNQLNVWQQVVDSNHYNITNADFIENRTFSGGVVYDHSVETSRTESNSFDFNFYINYGVAVDIGASIAGIGLYGGVAVSGRSTWGSIVSTDSTQTTTVGYVLSDDDLGDSYTVDIKRDKVYGVPTFKLVAGRSSCPWEEGTLPREGVQLISNTYSQTVEETQQAVFVLQLSNTSQSNETMTYDLIFDHTSNPDGAILTIGGSPVVGNVPYPYTIAPGGSVNATITASKGPIASTYSGLKFTLKSSCDDQISSDVYLNAHFYHNNILTVAVNGSGTTNVSVGTHPYQEGSNVILFASPASGYVFQKWIVGTDEFTTQAIQVTMSTDITTTAYFIPTISPQFTLQISNVGNGTSIPPVGSYVYNQGSTVNLTAIPDLNNAFVSWVINGQTITDFDTVITITQNTTAIANFVETHSLSVAVAQGNGTTYPSEGIHICHDGSVLHLYASPAPGFAFEKWVINTVEYFTQNVDLTIISDVTAQAYFTATSTPQDTVTISVTGNGITNPPAGTHYFAHGSTISLLATPNPGMVFQKWIVNSLETTNNPINLTITGDVSVEAVFVIDNTVGIVENKYDNIVSIYPNPSNGLINIKSTYEIESILITDITGKVVYNENKISSLVHLMNLENLNSGIYFVKLYTKTESNVFKIQIVK
ncbi:MAG: T9SS type A sorting domain-containing protein [Bacteroidia bacterium]|nr:T9SS type A sorting domain-containing protein [Bacteroidia bacterium]